MRSLPTVPAGRCGVVTLAELLEAGWTYEAVRHGVRCGRLERVAAGCVAPVPGDLDRFRRAEVLLMRQAVAATIPVDRVAVSHLAAALHRNLPVWAPTLRGCVTTWHPGIRRVAGLHVHRALDTAWLARRGGVPVTSAARTIVDIAREFGTEAALVPGDVALRAGAITRASLAAEVQRCRGLPGIGAAARVGALLDPLSESPLESRSRWHFDAHGIPPPLSQVRIHTRGGVFLGRVDHFWAEGVVGEVDGSSKYRGPDDRVLDREKWRQQGFEDVDLGVVRWGAQGLRDFTPVAERIARARRRARQRLLEGDLQWYALDARGGRVPVPGVGEP